MFDINTAYLNFIDDFTYVIRYIKSEYGDANIIALKNRGQIPIENIVVNDPKIKRYLFHGIGCRFSLKDGRTVDVEVYDHIYGFTDWSFLSYLRNHKQVIGQNEVHDFLNHLVSAHELKCNSRIYYLAGDMLNLSFWDRK